MIHVNKKTIVQLIALLLTGHALLFYALSPKVFILVFLVLIVVFIKIGWQNAITFSVTLAIVTFVIGITLEALMTNESIYYRPHEMLSHPDGRYEKNVRFEMTMPHGDLKALALYTEVETEPRKVIFHTDSSGFRNFKEYHGQEYLFVGDSFIVGNGTTQQDNITEQLLKKYSIDVYNMAFPGGIGDYYKLIKSFQKKYEQKTKVILFLFEGNDFPLNKNNIPVLPAQNTVNNNPAREIGRNYHKLFSETIMYRFMYSTTRRIIAANIKREKEKVEVRKIGELPIAFYKEYIKVTERDYLPENTETELYLSALKDDIEHIFFIPTKYRVYYAHINNNKQKDTQGLPNKQWQYVESIGQKLDISTTNLTPALIKESDRLLEDGILTYWRDDTHWNKYGMAVAADIINKELFQRN